MPKKLDKKQKANVHKELNNFEIKINSFGEMEMNYSIDQLNQFLDDKLGKERRQLKDGKMKK
jgi:hypothetical protein